MVTWMPNKLIYMLYGLFIGCLLPNTAYSFKVDTHVWVGQQVLNDLNNDHALDFNVGGQKISIAPRSDVAEAILKNPKIFLAGNMGPDAFPDPIVGQLVVHPGALGIPGKWETDDWLAWLIEQAERGPKKSDSAIAFAYGYQSHAAADIFSHTYVNQYSGRPFILTDDEPQSEVRHILLETLISHYTPSINQETRAAVDVDGAANFISESLIFNSNVAEQYQPSTSGIGAPHILGIYQIREQLQNLLDSERIDKIEQDVAKYLWQIYVSEYVGGYNINSEQAQKLINMLNKANGYNYTFNQYIQGVSHNFHNLVREQNLAVYTQIQQEIESKIKLLDQNKELHDKIGDMIIDGYCDSAGKPIINISLNPQEACYQSGIEYNKCLVNSKYFPDPISVCQNVKKTLDEKCRAFNETDRKNILNNIFWSEERQPILAQCRIELEERKSKCIGIYGQSFDSNCVKVFNGYDQHGSALYVFHSDPPPDNSICWRLSTNERLVVSLPDAQFLATGIAQNKFVASGKEVRSWHDWLNPLDPGGLVKNTLAATIKLHESIFEKTIKVAKPFIALDKTLANNLGIPYPDNLVCQANKLTVSIDNANVDANYYLAKSQLQSANRKFSSIQKLIDTIAQQSDAIDAGVASLHPRDWNPIRAHAIWWIDGINEAMTEYVKANSRVLANTVSPSISDDQVFQPLKDWLCNYKFAIAGTSAEVSKAVCLGERNAESITNEINELKDVLGVEYLIDKQIDNLIAGLEEKAKNIVIKQIEKQLDPDQVKLFKLLSDRSLKDERLDIAIDSAFNTDPNNTGLLVIPNTSARIKAEMFANTSQFDPNRYAVAYNAVVMAKLSLLDQNGLSQLMRAFGVSSGGEQFNYSGLAPAYVSGILFNGVRSIDGSYQWMGIAPPFPRRDGFKINTEANSPALRNFGYLDHDNKSRMFIWGNTEAREKIFRKLFKGPISSGIDEPMAGFTSVLPASYPYNICSANPFPSNENDNTCIIVKVLIPILSIMLN
jgi:hypothetical protein